MMLLALSEGLQFILMERNYQYVCNTCIKMLVIDALSVAAVGAQLFEGRLAQTWGLIFNPGVSFSIILGASCHQIVDKKN